VRGFGNPPFAYPLLVDLNFTHFVRRKTIARQHRARIRHCCTSDHCSRDRHRRVAKHHTYIHRRTAQSAHGVRGSQSAQTHRAPPIDWQSPITATHDDAVGRRLLYTCCATSVQSVSIVHCYLSATCPHKVTCKCIRDYGPTDLTGYLQCTLTANTKTCRIVCALI
jgi:hypothetical protein